MRLCRTVAILATAMVVASCGSAQDIADGGGDAEPSPTAEATAVEPTSSPETSSAPATTGETSSEPTTAPTEPSPALAPEPKVGNCYSTGAGSFQRQRDGSFPVNCSKTHTAETFAVFKLGVFPSTAALRKVWRDCQPRFKRYVGASPTVSRLGLTVILPSSHQTRAGHDWVRCDAIEMINYNGKAGARRRGSVHGVLSDGVPRSLRGCVRHWPKVDQPVHFTSCNENHQAELIPESKSLGGPDDPFPGLEATRSASKSFCEAVFQDYVPETLNYYYYYPTAQSWQSGSHDTTCWALDVSGDGLPPI